MISKLAIYGGKPVRRKPFPIYRTLDKHEERAVARVVRRGALSDFIGAKGAHFYGGEMVRKLEGIYKEHCKVKYAVSMNSATSVIIAAMGAFGIGPGDEVIVTPYSHVISATAPLLYDAVPVFSDSESDTFCMSVESIEKCITPRTRAIIVVDLFGQSADMDPIMKLARKKRIKVLSDSSHITSAVYKNKRAGTLADIGCYSLNSHKTINSGEGGIAVTDNSALAFKLQLLRNHAENCVAAMGVTDLINMLGYNFRMTELEAAVAIEQMKKKDYLVGWRRRLCEHLNRRLSGLRGITPPVVRPGCTHDYLIYAIRYDSRDIGISRDEFMRRLDAEGIKIKTDDQRHVPPLGTFVKPIHLQPIFAERIFRPKGCPWKCRHYRGRVSYRKGICPVVEDLWENSLICINAIYPPLKISDMDDIADAFEKVITLSR